jgi:predicted transposase YbfD/YdcC
VAVGSESNEIPAIPALLGVLKLGGTVVTIDAMGYRTARPQPGRLQRGGRKDTHPTLHELVTPRHDMLALPHFW